MKSFSYMAAMIAVVGSPALGQSGAKESVFEKIPPGATLVLPADVGTRQDILGKGFSDAFSEFDAEGKTHRVFASKATKSAENRYDIQFEMIDNQLKFAANAKLLFAHAGVRSESQKRFMVLRVFHLTEVDSLDAEGDPVGTAALVAQKVYYGWALYVIVEGESSAFTAEAASEIVQGGSLEIATKKYHLKTYTKTIGLSPKASGDIPIVTDPRKISEHFKEAETPSPIFVEYRVLKNVFSEQLPWAKAKLRAGRYRLLNVAIRISKTRGDGQKWHMLAGFRPVVDVMLDGKKIVTLSEKNVFEKTFEVDKIIELKPNSAFSLSVEDKHTFAKSNKVGAATLDHVVDVGAPFQAMDMLTTGQLTSASLTLVPIDK